MASRSAVSCPTADEAVRNLCSAVERFGCDWPLPPAREHRDYRLADAPVPVTFAWAGEQRQGHAAAYTADEVWVSWEQARGHDRAAWVSAETVDRVAGSRSPGLG